VASILETAGDLLRAFVRSVERRETSLRSVLAGAAKGASRDVLRWALGASVKYLLAAGLAIAAVAYLLSALHGVLAGPVGLPGYVASLILSALGAAGAALLLKSGAAAVREPAPERGVTLKIVRDGGGGPPPAPSARATLDVQVRDAARRRGGRRRR
jgi:hypothetical protein